MSSSSLAMQQQIYTLLLADAVLVAALGGSKVYDYIPETQVFPWIRIGEDTAKDWNTDGWYGKEFTANIHTWSRKQGRSECKTLMGMIQRILNGVTITVTGSTVVLFQLEFENTMVDPDGVTTHGVQRFRALIQEGA